MKKLVKIFEKTYDFDSWTYFKFDNQEKRLNLD